MSVVRLKRGKTVWEIQVPDAPPDEAKEWALTHANGQGRGKNRIQPSNGKGGWKVDAVIDDQRWHEQRNAELAEAAAGAEADRVLAALGDLGGKQ